MYFFFTRDYVLKALNWEIFFFIEMKGKISTKTLWSGDGEAHPSPIL
jgi:hypothetical protein